jgi:hypothetical protein
VVGTRVSLPAIGNAKLGSGRYRHTMHGLHYAADPASAHRRHHPHVLRELRESLCGAFWTATGNIRQASLAGGLACEKESHERVARIWPPWLAVHFVRPPLAVSAGNTRAREDGEGEDRDGESQRSSAALRYTPEPRTIVADLPRCMGSTC